MEIFIITIGLIILLAFCGYIIRDSRQFLKEAQNKKLELEKELEALRGIDGL